MSKNGFKSILLAAAVVTVIVIGIRYYLKELPREFAQSVVVLAFLDRVGKLDLSGLQNWLNAGMAIEYNDNCVAENSDRAVSCITDVIKKLASRTSDANVDLVVLADHTHTNNLFAAYEHAHLEDEAKALVLIQAGFNFSDAEKINLPKTVVINTPQDAAEDFIARRRAIGKLLENDNWIWSTTLSTENINSLIEHPVLPEMILYLLDKQEKVQYLAEFNAESRWQQPLFDNEVYFAVDEAINEYPVDHDLQRILAAFFHHEPYQLKQWPLNTYLGFDLLTYRSLLPVEEQGRYVTFTNRKGHRFFLDLDRYGRYQPELVVGIDDERNLYRMSTFYRTKRFYSWEPGGPDPDTLYVQSLGAFIHFRKSLPQQYELPFLQYSTIKFDSIAFSNIDPYAGIKNLTQRAFRVLTQNCIPCHSVDGIGGAAYHMDSQTGEPQPGFARPLRTYSKEIYQNFFFNQTTTAALIGVNPNYVERRVAEELLPWLTENE